MRFKTNNLISKDKYLKINVLNNLNGNNLSKLQIFLQLI